MSESSGAVFLSSRGGVGRCGQADLQRGPAGPFVPWCKEVDTGGAFIEMMCWKAVGPDGRD